MPPSYGGALSNGLPPSAVVSTVPLLAHNLSGESASPPSGSKFLSSSPPMIVENDVRRPLPLPSASLNENVGGSHRISLNVSASNLSKLMGNGNQKQGGDSDDNAHVAGTGTDKTTAAPPALVLQDNADTQKREMERRAASAATPTTSSNLNPGDVRFLIATQWFNLWRAYANGESKTSPPIDIDQASLAGVGQRR